MEATELRIGNYVDVINRNGQVHLPAGATMKVASVYLFACKLLRPDEPIYVQKYSCDLHSKDISPIELTEEWLLKFGFEMTLKSGNLIDYKIFQLKEFTYNTTTGWWWQYYLLPIQPLHVHQLQNLYFALTGEELTIKQQENASK